MDGDPLMHASRRERELYAELEQAYAALAALIGDERGIDAARLTAARERAAEASERLRVVAATVAPRRLTGEPVSDEIAALWRTSAELATRAAARNAALLHQAHTRQAAIGARLSYLDAGRRAVARYEECSGAPCGARAAGAALRS